MDTNNIATIASVLSFQIILLATVLLFYRRIKMYISGDNRLVAKGRAMRSNYDSVILQWATNREEATSEMKIELAEKIVSCYKHGNFDSSLESLYKDFMVYIVKKYPHLTLSKEFSTDTFELVLLEKEISKSLVKYIVNNLSHILKNEYNIDWKLLNDDHIDLINRCDDYLKTKYVSKEGQIRKLDKDLDRTLDHIGATVKSWFDRLPRKLEEIGKYNKENKVLKAKSKYYKKKIMELYELSEIIEHEVKPREIIGEASVSGRGGMGYSTM